MLPITPGFTSSIGLVVSVCWLRSDIGAEDSEELRLDAVELSSDVIPYSHSAIAVLSPEIHSVEEHDQRKEY